MSLIILPVFRPHRSFHLRKRCVVKSRTAITKKSFFPNFNPQGFTFRADNNSEYDKDTNESELNDTAPQPENTAPTDFLTTTAKLAEAVLTIKDKSSKVVFMSLGGQKDPDL
ncbi:unnamed protein product [Didymodactylos carnosus]|uniref:Uncharacterized protein n=1 Tax=Didymodactylos carnosus TaxID=1234261 RepID=A0A814KC51_9BILA|nr:unnamed protein product [Didymodactylos carnosus]CAF3818682.1 unnamed protein product [Didymodactylos carnosus]